MNAYDAHLSPTAQPIDDDALAQIEALLEDDAVKGFSEDEPRDDHGRWGSGGSSHAKPTNRVSEAFAAASGLTAAPNDPKDIARAIGTTKLKYLTDAMKQQGLGWSKWKHDAEDVKAAMAGVADATKALEESNPAVAAYMRSHVIVGTMFNKEGLGEAVTGTSNGKKSIIAFNTDKSPDDTLSLAQKNPDTTVSGKIALEVLAKTGDRIAAVRAMYRSIYEHEQGHVIDFAHEKAGETSPSGEVEKKVVQAIRSMPFDRGTKWMAEKLGSTYAREGGPKEAWAEIYAAHVTGRVSPEFRAMAKEFGSMRLVLDHKAPKPKKAVDEEDDLPDFLIAWSHREAPDMLDWREGPDDEEDEEKGFGDSHFDPDEERDDHGRWGSGGHADFKPMAADAKKRVELRSRKLAIAAIAEKVGATPEQVDYIVKHSLLPPNRRGDLTDEQIGQLVMINAAIYEYTGSGYRDLNGALRKGGKLSKDEQAMLDMLTLTKVDLPKGTITYRGLNAVKAGIDPEKFQVGKTFRLKGFSSSSLDARTAETFGNNNKVVLAIKAKRASWLPSDSDGDEKELVLPRNTLFKVKGFTKSKDGTRMVQVEQLLYGQKEADFDIEVH